MDLRKSLEFFDPTNMTERVHIIGCGATGSTLCELLARFGFTKFTIYDFDVVERKNIANQMFFNEDVGKEKVNAVKDMFERINPDILKDLKIKSKGWDSDRLSGYVFLCVDNIDLRRRIVEENMMNPYIKAMFDFRLGLTESEHHAADWTNADARKKFLATMQFTHEEALAATPRSACHEILCVAPTVRLIAANGVMNFVNFLRTGEMKKLIIIDTNTFENTVF